MTPPRAAPPRAAPPPAFLFSSRAPSDAHAPRAAAPPSSARLRHARALSPARAPDPAPAAHPRRMDSSFFDYFDVCATGLWHTAPPPTPRPAAPPMGAKVTNALGAVSARLKGWLPRRLHEPTGPWGLMLDMLLSLFVAHGACRSVIDALPLEVVGENGGDLESCGAVSAPVREGDKCAICLGCYEEGDAVRHLGCKHAFHAECVDVWLERKSLCPICKTDTC